MGGWTLGGVGREGEGDRVSFVYISDVDMPCHTRRGAGLSYRFSARLLVFLAEPLFCRVTGGSVSHVMIAAFCSDHDRGSKLRQHPA